MSDTAFAKHYTGTYTLHAVWCCYTSCGVPFGIEAHAMERLKETHERFYCPRGHGQSFTGETKEQKLKQHLENANRRTAMAEENERIARADALLERRRSAAYRGHLTRMRRRIANGVCPCCQRSFQNVKRHMATKHPDVLERVVADEKERTL